MVLDNAKFEQMSRNYPSHIRPAINPKVFIQRQYFGSYTVFCVMGIAVYFLAYSTFNWAPYTLFGGPKKTYKAFPDYLNHSVILKEAERKVKIEEI